MYSTAPRDCGRGRVGHPASSKEPLEIRSETVEVDYAYGGRDRDKRETGPYHSSYVPLLEHWLNGLVKNYHSSSLSLPVKYQCTLASGFMRRFVVVLH